jgi:DNA-binding transcriptional LysR family regulator
MEARQISYFLAVVEHGGFGRAASALQVAQPTLSQSVKALERELGTELFHRASPGVVLSAAGRALLGPARQLMRDVAAARQSVGARPEQAVVELVAAPPLGVHPGAALVGSFSTSRPDICVRLDRADVDDQLAGRVRDGSSELGLTYLPVERLGLVEVELGAHELMLAFPPGTRLKPGPIPLAELTGVRLLGLPRGNWQRDLVETALRSAGVRTRLAMELAHRDMIVDLVLAGAGAAFIVDAAAPEAVARGAQVRAAQPAVRRSFGLVHRGAPLSEPASAFLLHAESWSGRAAG